MNRFKFYGANDASIGFHFDRIKKVMEGAELNNDPTLLDILEFYNIKKLLKENIYPSKFSKNQIKNIKGVFSKKINIFFSSLNKEDIVNYLVQLFSTSSNIDLKNYHNPDNVTKDTRSKFIFRDDFLECFENFQLDKKITENNLKNIINKFSIPVYFFLKSTYFSNRYPELIKMQFLADTQNFELFLSNYIVDRNNYVIPENISSVELYKFCERYIKDSSDLDFLQLIKHGIKGIKRLNIDAKLKLKSQKKIKQIEEIFWNGENDNKIIRFSQKIFVYRDKESYRKSNKDALKILIDEDYIRTHSSPESLLNYLMYMDYFFNRNWILNLCSFPNLESSTFARIFNGPKTKRSYETSFYFENKNSLVLQAFRGFQYILSEKLGLRIEDLINYFFKEYCKNNFSLEWLPISFADKKEKINIQAKNLFIVEEQIRKQWNLFVDQGKINKDLFLLESTPRIYDLESLMKKKYIYLNEKNLDANRILHLLFSDQSHLNAVKNGNQYWCEKSFMLLLSKYKIKYSSFSNDQQSDINYLIKINILKKGKNDTIYPNKKQVMRIKILSMIFNYGVINYYKGFTKVFRDTDLKKQQNEIDEMLEDGILKYEETLFSRPESDYLNYLLNNSVFDNSLGIRNKYLHGSILEDNIKDMLRALVILTIYVIKINEELTFNSHYERDKKIKQKY